MSDTLEAVEWLARVVLTVLLFPFLLLLTLGVVGVGYSTTDTSAGEALFAGAMFSATIIGCVVLAFRAKRVWLRWLALLTAYAPALLVFGGTALA